MIWKLFHKGLCLVFGHVVPTYRPANCYVCGKEYPDVETHSMNGAVFRVVLFPTVLEFNDPQIGAIVREQFGRKPEILDDRAPRALQELGFAITEQGLQRQFSAGTMLEGWEDDPDVPKPERFVVDPEAFKLPGD